MGRPGNEATSVDWSKLIEDLVRAGFQMQTIAARAGLTVWQVSDLRNGMVEEPRYSAGLRLQDMHRQASDAGLIAPFSEYGSTSGRLAGSQDVALEVRELCSLICTKALARRVKVTPETVNLWRDHAHAAALHAERVRALHAKCKEVGLI